MDTKWLGQSKTIIAIVLAMFVSLAPEIGISFGSDEAALINEVVDKFVEFVLLVIAAFGRFVADTPLRMKP